MELPSKHDLISFEILIVVHAYICLLSPQLNKLKYVLQAMLKLLNSTNWNSSGNTLISVSTQAATLEEIINFADTLFV